MSFQMVIEMLEAKVQQFGFAVQGVFGDPAQEIPPFCYTIGLAESHMPELIIVAAPPEASMSILNHIVFSYLLEGKVPVRGDRITHVLDGDKYPLRLGNVASIWTENDWLTMASMRQKTLGGPPIKALQVVWPDISGTWPHEENYFSPHECFPQSCLAERAEWDYLPEERVLRATDRDDIDLMPDLLRARRAN